MLDLQAFIDKGGPWHEARLIGNCLCLLGDCREIVSSLPSLNAVITDPPYGIGFKYHQYIDSDEGYGAWLWSILEALEGRCFPGSPFFVFQAMLNIRMFSTWFPRNFRLFAACKNFVQMRPTPMQYAWDPVVVWWTEGKPYANGTANRDFYIANTAVVVRNKNNVEKGHPCPRPLDTMRHIIDQWVIPGGLVCDLFAGSFTTALACQQLGRQSVSIEIDPYYYALGCTRLEEAMRQGQLFPPSPPQTEQIALL